MFASREDMSTMNQGRTAGTHWHANAHTSILTRARRRGFTADSSTWEPEADIARILIRKFDREVVATSANSPTGWRLVESASDDATQDPNKKKRGRPKGSTKKEQTEPDQGDGARSHFDDVDAEQQAARRQDSKRVPHEKHNKDKEHKQQKLALEIDTAAGSQDATASSQPQQLPRKRGRPRKVPLVPIIASVEVDGEGDGDGGSARSKARLCMAALQAGEAENDAEPHDRPMRKKRRRLDVACQDVACQEKGTVAEAEAGSQGDANTKADDGGEGHADAEADSDAGEDAASAQGEKADSVTSLD